MCRSSRVTRFMLTLLPSLSPSMLPCASEAQLYGFPIEAGVVDDGFGVLPPTPTVPSQAGFPSGPGAPPPFLVPPPASPPCPLVIRVGRGLQRPAQVRVVYGRPSPCS